MGFPRCFGVTESKSMARWSLKPASYARAMCSSLTARPKTATCAPAITVRKLLNFDRRNGPTAVRAPVRQADRAGQAARESRGVEAPTRNWPPLRVPDRLELLPQNRHRV